MGALTCRCIIDNQDLTKLYQSQISLSEWLDGMQHGRAEEFRIEDNAKRDRLDRLNQLIGLPYDKPRKFAAADVMSPTREFKEFLRDHGGELCAIRLIPTAAGLPKLRTRGLTIRNAVQWMGQQQFEPARYQADFVPHDDQSTWATIFIINQRGIFGEITAGLHSDLTQGSYSAHLPNTFFYDFDGWQLARPGARTQSYLEKITGMVRVGDPAMRRLLKSEFGAAFSRNFLHGYYETTDSQEFGIWFKDYNRLLPLMYADMSSVREGNNGALQPLLSGQPGSPGRATGRVRVIDGPQAGPLRPDEILVCRMTTPDYIPLMQQAAAIVTDLGGVLSHAAIVARELGKPCLAGTGNATKVLTDGQLVLVDADAGTVVAA